MRLKITLVILSLLVFILLFSTLISSATTSTTTSSSSSSSSTTTSTTTSSTTTTPTTTFPPVNDLILDVGNDTEIPWEWSQPNTFTGPETTPDLSNKLNEILSTGCNCEGCKINGPECAVPITVRSSYAGTMELRNIEVDYGSSEVLSSVTYGESFKLSEGCEWHIRFQGPTEETIINIPASYSGPNVCYYMPPLEPIDTEDALIDAVYRLLRQEDHDGSGVVNINFDVDTMSFETHGMIGVKSLWGPAVIKLVIWI